MTTFNAPLDDLAFVLHDVLGLGGPSGARYAELGRDVTGAVLAEAGRLAQEVLHPLNATGDRQGCRLDAGIVHTPEGFRDAYAKLCAGGWTGLACAPEYGGQGMPYVLHTAVNEIFASANMALNMYQGLSHGAYSAILAHGTEAQRRTCLPPLASGAWTGTMNLTEPHCGTDLGLLRTKAEPQADGSYRITGQKIFISAGDHDLAGNVIHLVLARAPGGGEGTRGISLFIVPKFTLGPDGQPHKRNAVSVGKIESKMGIHGNATCVMNYDGARGELLGGLHKGMQAMFTMMNEARLGVGLQGYAIAEVARQNAVSYARERLQGRAVPAPAFPDRPADPLIVHPDIRRMLMDQKSFVEGARTLTLWGAALIDGAAGGDPADAEMIGLLTPVIKAFLTDKGFEACVSAQQVWGGHGYIEENGMAQFVRDARITQIYEGANGIQALDLVGRKLAHDGGKELLAFVAAVERFADEHGSDPDDFAADFLVPVRAAIADLKAAALHFLEEGARDPNLVLAGSTDFLHLFGYLALGFMWARMAAAARAALAAGDGNSRFLEAKLTTARYYMAQQLPATALHLERITRGAGAVTALAADDF